MTKVNVYSMDGTAKDKIELPSTFDDEVREDLIKRAVLSEESEKLQPKGNFYRAGLQTTARYVGRKEAYHSLKNKGQPMLPRVMFPKGRFGTVRIVPWAVKGRAAHPPHPEKVLFERINEKEKKKALRSAIAATAYGNLVKAVHKVDIQFPIIIEDGFEEVKKTKDVMSILGKIKIDTDVDRVKRGRKARTSRKGGVKTPRSILIVVSGQKPLLKAAHNIPGVDVAKVDEVKVSQLAPGGRPGRLTIWSVSALKKLQ